MNNGIVYIVFGEAFEAFAFDCMKHSRNNTSYPIHILTNIQDLETRWNQFDNMTFEYLDCLTEDNRQIKTQAIYYTPFENTLLLDADAIIKSEISFEFVDNCDIALSRLYRWEQGQPILGLYKKAFIQFDVHLPVDVVCGAFVMFKRNTKCIDFFDLWNEYWIDFGKARDMPCLVSAIYNSDILVKLVPDNYFAPVKLIKESTIQHDDSENFCNEYNIKPMGEIDHLTPDTKLWNEVYYE